MKINTNVKMLSLILALIMLCGACVSCKKTGDGATTTEMTSAETTVPETEPETEPPKTVFTLHDAGTMINIHTDLQQSYLNGKYNLIAKYASGVEELSRPAAIVLTWDMETVETGIVKQYLVRVSENEDMSNAREFKIYDVKKAEIYNCKLGTTYYWTVEAVFAEASYMSAVASFSTGWDMPRNLYVDGITNVRDLGGWETADGGRVKQGLIYRCGRLNSNSSATAEITAAGKRVMINDLGIKTEIDLRLKGSNGNITVSPLGKDVAYHLCPMGYSFSKGDILTNNTAEIINVFKILGNEENYPIIFHCSIGTDRTGMIAFLINGLLGVSKDDLYRDYLYSNFGKIGSSRNMDAINNYIKDVSAYPGSTLSEQIYNYLIAQKVPAADIDNVIRILKDN